MNRPKSLQLAFWAAVCLAVQLPTAHAAIVISGNVDPADAGDWNSDTNAYVGRSADGQLEVNGGSDLASDYGYIGHQHTATGQVTVTGPGSTWTNDSYLYVGYSGSGTLNISGGAAVTSNSGFIGRQSDSTGVVTVDGVDSTWTHYYLHVGCFGSGTLDITGGADVNSSYGYIGESSNSTGEVTADGHGSTWTNMWDLRVGYYGNGTLDITGGADVSNSRAEIGFWTSVTGVVTVAGAGSTWTNSDDLFVGYYGRATLNISDGAEVSVAGHSTFVSYSTFAGQEPGSMGLIDFGTGGGTLTTGSLFATPTELIGTGTINTRGLVSDVDLVFDSTAGLAQDFVLNSEPDQNVTVHFDMASDPSNNGALGAGWRGHGSLTIRDGVTVNSANGYIGYRSSSTGVATVEGTGSTWNNGDNLYVGYEGSGTLNISGGAEALADHTYVGYEAGSTGLIDFCTGGTLTTRSLSASPNQLTGTGTINTRGLVSDVEVLFDSPASLAQTLTLDSQPDQNVTVHLDMASDPSSNGVLGAGWRGHGSLAIRNGVTLNSDYGYIGYHSTSTAEMTVEGPGSTWISGSVYVGYYGRATLNITGGAAVSNSSCHISRFSPSTGVVTVDGAGSTWNSGTGLYVGGGTLNIMGGAVVSSDHAFITSRGRLAIDVGNGSLLEIDGGSGRFTHYGELCILAGAGATAGNVYQPIAAGRFETSSPTYQPVGGTWDTTSHQFTVSGVTSGTSGAMVTIDRSLTQRVLIDDTASGWSIGASFLAADAASDLHLTATVVSGSMLADLESLLDVGDAVRGAWTFELTGGYTEGEPAYLSFDLGPGFDRSQVNVWHYDGSQWTEYAAADLTCNGDYASFTVTGFSGYAVSAVPEPGSLALLAAAALALLAQARWKPKRSVPNGTAAGSPGDFAE